MTWFKHSFASQLPSSMYSFQEPIPVRLPEMVLYNDQLANELGMENAWSPEKALSILSGNMVLEGSKSISQAYAGHQFGHFTRLGDGRAVLLGEIDTPNGLNDLQLKGSGRTPYSRRGDGRATLYSMLREYLISESMHSLGIPTTRSLAVVKTGEEVYREVTHEGGILSRVAKSHIRVGTFEFAGFLGSETDLSALLDYTVERHYPELLHEPNMALTLLEKVMLKQKDLVIDWLRVGFIHGVMNTDNVSIAGETIDYGPCAFMNTYKARTVFSSIDRAGRYAFVNQPDLAYWNMKVFAHALLPMIDPVEEEALKKAEVVLARFPKMFSKSYLNMMTNKLGIENHVEADFELVKECLEILEKYEIDYTNFFTHLKSDGQLVQNLKSQLDFQEWYEKWEVARIRMSDLDRSGALMEKTNPVVIPRNHLVEEVLEKAIQGDMKPFHDLFKSLSNPYDRDAKSQSTPTEFDEGYQTFCGT
ncbi:MAG: YdiU family protein [Bacteroidota bacterium]